MTVSLIFPLIMILFFASVHALAYTRVIKRLHSGPGSRTRLKYFLILNMTGIVGYLASRYAFTPPKFVYFFLSLSIGVGFILFIGTLLYELFHLLQRLLPFSPEKRIFFQQTGELGLFAAGGAYLGASVAEGAKDPAVVFIDVSQNRFARSYRIVQISDMHIGGLIDRDFVARSVDTINRLEADLIVITGDLCDAHIDTLTEAVGELRRLKSRYGVFYIVGNHEYFHSLNETIAYVKTLGIEVLENASVLVEEFYVVGVYDLFGLRAGVCPPDIDRAMENVPSEAPTLLLAHQPKFIDYLSGFKPSLILCGHTHGGQLWPFGYLVGLAQPYVKGLHPLGENRHIYVNSGIGFWGPPMRLGSKAEITCITWS